MTVTDYIFTNLLSYNRIGHKYFFLHRREVSVCDLQWTEKFRLPTVRVTGKQITAPEGEDDRKPPDTEGDMDNTGTAPEGVADKTKGLAPNSDNADCYMWSTGDT
jgi:hypothetical protein